VGPSSTTEVEGEEEEEERGMMLDLDGYWMRVVELWNLELQLVNERRVQRDWWGVGTEKRVIAILSPSPVRVCLCATAKAEEWVVATSLQYGFKSNSIR
jgi:hypothetical protein